MKMKNLKKEKSLKKTNNYKTEKNFAIKYYEEMNKSLNVNNQAILKFVVL